LFGNIGFTGTEGTMIGDGGGVGDGAGEGEGVGQQLQLDPSIDVVKKLITNKNISIFSAIS